MDGAKKVEDGKGIVLPEPKKWSQPSNRAVCDHGHTLEYSTYEYTTTNGRYKCNVCRIDTSSCAEGRWFCKPCRYDVCPHCRPSPANVAKNLYDLNWLRNNELKVRVHEHALVFKAQDDGWECDGKNMEGGCRSGIKGFDETSGKDRYRCAKCDYDMCEKCVEEYIIYP